MVVPESMKQEIRDIADHFGVSHQLSMLQEECAELIQAVSKMQRAGEWEDQSGLSEKLKHTEARYRVAEEMADVWIMLLQVEYLLENTGLVELYARQKVGRTKRRISQGVENEK